MIILRLFTRKWLLATILVIAAIGVMVRLGFWQLDRLAQRRAFNDRVRVNANGPEMGITGISLTLDYTALEYRPVTVTGEYDFANQVALRNQAWNNQYGVHLLTPMKIAGTEVAVLVDRGWIPGGDNVADWGKYDQPGTQQIHGVVRLSQVKPALGGRADPVWAEGDPPIRAWNFATIESIARQLPYLVLPAYVQLIPPPSGVDMSGSLPIPSPPELDLTEGSHESYAIQWFSFAAVFAVGYPFFVSREEKRQRQS